MASLRPLTIHTEQSLALSQHDLSLPVRAAGQQLFLLTDAALFLGSTGTMAIRWDRKVHPAYLNVFTIWSTEAVLSKSPYLKYLLTSDFLEGSVTTSHSAKPDRPVEPLPFDHSDGEQDEKTDKPPPSRIISPLPKRRISALPHHRIAVTETAYTTYLAVIPDPLAAVSPKSVYRLAHLLELPQLASLALADFQVQLTVHNAASELFSETSGCYDELRDIALAS
ncbi:hypothetical protein JCM8547_008825 [Rhodosporidiobolus lusitaniae]